MSMRDKGERDWLKDRNADSKVRSIHNDSLNELLDIADEKDDLALGYEQAMKNYAGLEIRCSELQTNLEDSKRLLTKNREVEFFTAHYTEVLKEKDVKIEELEEKLGEVENELKRLNRLPAFQQIEQAQEAHEMCCAIRDVAIKQRDGWQIKFIDMEKELAEAQEDNKGLAQCVRDANEVCNELEGELAEVRKLHEATSRDCNNTALERNDERDRRCKAEGELERLRKAVPEDVEGAIELCFKTAVGFGDTGYVGHYEKTKGKLITLIGSLVERKREDLEGAWKDGFKKACSWANSIPHDTYLIEDARIYADRKMKEAK